MLLARAGTGCLFFPPTTLLFIPAAPCSGCWDDARLRDSVLGPRGAWICKVKGRSRSPGRSTKHPLHRQEMSPVGGTSLRHPTHSWRGRNRRTRLQEGRSPCPAHPSCPKVMFSLKRRLSSRSSCVMWHHFSLQRTNPFWHRHHPGTPPLACIPPFPGTTLAEDRRAARAPRLPAHMQRWMSSHTRIHLQISRPGGKARDTPGKKSSSTLAF